MSGITGGVQRSIRRYLRENHGNLYLPAENVELAMNALSHIYTDMHIEEKIRRDGIRKLVVYRLTVKTMKQVFMVYIR